MTNKYTAIKKVKGFSSAYPNVCNLKILPNIDETRITIQDDVGTSITIKLSDLELAISIIKSERELAAETGEWITFNEGHIRNGNVVTTSMIFCSKCNGEVDYKSNFCPNCGAKMIDEQERSDKENGNK